MMVADARRIARTLCSVAALSIGALARAQAPVAPLPAPADAMLPPTQAPISEADLRFRLYQLADDSLAGRAAGERGDWVATGIIAEEFRRLGLKPAGDSGTYFQNVPLVVGLVDSLARVSVHTSALRLWTDFVPAVGGRGFATGPIRRIDNARVIFGGTLGDTAHMISSVAAAGRFVVLATPRDASGKRSPYYWRYAGLDRFPGAAAIAVVALDVVAPFYLDELRAGIVQPAPPPGAPSVPAPILVSEDAAGVLLGRPLARARPGDGTRKVRGSVGSVLRPLPSPARNVVAVLPGSDPALRGTYVALSAHNDHIGIAPNPVDHDSLHIANMAYERVAPQRGRDSARKLHPPRPDSIFNGADDDGSGTVALLEIAESLSVSGVRPKRSLLFVSHTAEEVGLVGSKWYADHATVPRDSIMAEIDMDMVGRGRPEDVRGGGPGYLEIVGSRRLSSELGRLTDSIATRQRPPFVINYEFDVPGHPEQYYCRADHFSYARYGIPSLNMSRGDHPDYHEVTDEPQYIDFNALMRVVRFTTELALTVANLDHRLVVDGPRTDPKAPCVQ